MAVSCWNAAQHSDANRAEAQSVRGCGRLFKRKPVMDRLNKRSVGPLRDHLQRRMPSISGNRKHCHQSESCDHKILPCVQLPLTMPADVEPVSERDEIRDRPLVSVGTTRSDHIAKQMQMEAHESQERRFPAQGARK